MCVSNVILQCGAGGRKFIPNGEWDPPDVILIIIPYTRLTDVVWLFFSECLIAATFLASFHTFLHFPFLFYLLSSLPRLLSSFFPLWVLSFPLGSVLNEILSAMLSTPVLVLQYRTDMSWQSNKKHKIVFLEAGSKFTSIRINSCTYAFITHAIKVYILMSSIHQCENLHIIYLYHISSMRLKVGHFKGVLLQHVAV